MTQVYTRPVQKACPIITTSDIHLVLWFNAPLLPNYLCWWCTSVHHTKCFFILSQDSFFSFKLWFPFLLCMYVVFQYMYTLFTFVLSVHTITTNVILQTTFSLVLLACALACCSGQAISKSSLVYVFILLLVHDCFNVPNYSVFPVFISTIRYKIRSIYVFEKRHSYYVTWRNPSFLVNYSWVFTLVLGACYSCQVSWALIRYIVHRFIDIKM